MKAYKDLVKFALSTGHLVSVWDGEEWQVSKSGSYQAIIDAIESVEEAQLKIYTKSDTRGEGYKGWALVSAFGLEDDETVVDFTITPFMQEWDMLYNMHI
jgi:hypothetical protein